MPDTKPLDALKCGKCWKLRSRGVGFCPYCGNPEFEIIDRPDVEVRADGRFRLECTFCDAGYDGLHHEWQLQQLEFFGWTDIEEVRSYEESIAPVGHAHSELSVFDWQTHMGTCPDCAGVGSVPFAGGTPSQSVHHTTGKESPDATAD